MIKLKQLRKKYHLTQKELAKKLGTTQRNISYYECGVHSPDIYMLKRIAELFNVSIESLYEEE